ncbi:MAG: DUF4214 domain-containing protein, partial [Lachnospiraceae bacterium]|nr:DUF4214 domain-containing protein [Lachnospiraceae bacterium]
ITEGGFPSKSFEDNSGIQEITLNKNDMNSRRVSGFLGYIYLREVPEGYDVPVTLEPTTTPTTTPATTQTARPDTIPSSGTQEAAVEPSNIPEDIPYVAPTPSVEDFVTRLYQVALNREPDAEGLADWSARLRSGEAAAVNVVQGVLCSEEYLGKGKPNGEIVNDCYHAMLGRDADEAGYAEWVGKLDAGMSVNAIFAGFVGSQEFADLCAGYGITAGSYGVTEPRDQNLGVTAFVSRLYSQALGREYDVEGLNNWTAQILSNPCQENVLGVATNGFFHSEEFANKNLDNQAFVMTLYHTFLGREYDEAGLADWVGKLDRGEMSRDEVMGGFAYSQEFTDIMSSYGF